MKILTLIKPKDGQDELQAIQGPNDTVQTQQQRANVQGASY